ncbi:uncharacterized protein K441DRAFT_33180 [Cenococcum geophilum 1.58]|uniref:Uncharacterized protein n=1 Tax=Cenococcum geophilum 1.58 TaxID=794803 RepID=A0ACC8EKH5_9PEZI|nr:hypothetical protein K441DRAFT_33180 [Cenococcum geophilum 1.58]
MTDPPRNMPNSDVKSGASRQTPETSSNATSAGRYSLPTPISSFAVELGENGHRLADSTPEQQKPLDVVVEQPEKGKHKRIASTSESRSAATDNRLLRPQLALQRKRSRISPASILPALETTQLNPPFNVFTALLENNDLLLEVSSRLDIKSLIDLYAMSKDYHYLLNSHYTTYMKHYSLKRCPESAAIFRWTCYKSLCIVDPCLRPASLQSDRPRDIPSLRWLQMVLYREHVVSEILTLLALESHRVPRATTATIKKIWFILDMPTNGARIGYIQEQNCWGNRDLLLATMFFIKLDMRFSDPVDGNELMQMIVRTIPREDEDLDPRFAEDTVMGIAAKEIGALGKEGWGKGNDPMLRPDELIMMEGFRRRLNLQKYYVACMLWGYVDPRTGQNIPTPTLDEAQHKGDKIRAID